MVWVGFKIFNVESTLSVEQWVSMALLYTYDYVPKTSIESQITKSCDMEAAFIKFLALAFI